MPSIRQLARELTVNQNTVLRVYERLTAENLLQRRHGDGTFVAGAVPRRALQRQTEKFTEEFQRLVREGRMLGLDDTQLQSLLDQSLRRADEPAAERDGRGRTA